MAAPATWLRPPASLLFPLARAPLARVIFAALRPCAALLTALRSCAALRFLSAWSLLVLDHKLNNLLWERVLNQRVPVDHKKILLQRLGEQVRCVIRRADILEGDDPISHLLPHIVVAYSNMFCLP